MPSKQKPKNLSGSYHDDSVTIIANDPHQKEPKITFLTEQEYTKQKNAQPYRIGMYDELINAFILSPQRFAKIEFETKQIAQSACEAFYRTSRRRDLKWKIERRSNVIYLKKTS